MLSLKLTFQISDIDPPPEVAEADGAVAAPPSSPEDDLAEPTYITCSLLITKPAYANAVSVDLSAGEEGFDVTNVAIFAKTLGEMEGAEGDWQRRSRYLGPREWSAIFAGYLSGARETPYCFLNKSLKGNNCKIE